MIDTILKRDRTIVVGSLVLLSAFAWTYLLRLDAAMSDMPGMNMGSMLHPLSAAEIGYAVGMWAVMMVGMMTPSALPMIMLYANVGRRAREQRSPFAATGWFAGGYLFVWTAFASAAAVTQQLFAQAALISPMLVLTNRVVAGALLLLAGIWQWLPFKDRCLAQCQSPAMFLTRVGGFRRDPVGAFGQGARHGLYCVGCCWALMLLLFVGGVMNLLWVATLSTFVLIEKLAASGRLITRAAGLVAIGSGAILLAQSYK